MAYLPNFIPKPTGMKWKALKYSLPLLLYILILQSFMVEGWKIWWPLLLSFGVLPLVELLMPPDAHNISEAEEALAKDNKLYDWMLYLIVPLQYMAIYYFFQSLQGPTLPWWQTAGRVMVMGFACGTFGINVGHELGHRTNVAEQWMAKALLLTSLYTHFFIEHNKGHHKHVSTPQDPSSAPYQMSLYRFWIRSIGGVYAGAWQIANQEQRKKQLPLLHWKNAMLQLQVLQLVWLLALVYFFGVAVLPFYLAAAFMGILLLETVNYIEHYGLRRKEIADGKYERARPQHSWNSNHILGRIVLFELSRHSDHHYLASRKYQILRHHEDAPQLPTGYPGSMLLSTIPPLWFYIMRRQFIKYQLPIPEATKATVSR